MSDLEHAEAMGIFTFFPVVVPFGTGARRFILSAYSLRPVGGECFWLDPQASQGALLRRCEMSFERTCGVPPTLSTRALRPLGRANAWGDAVWTPQFLRLCTHYGCRPVQGTRDPVWEGALRDALLRRHYRDVGELEYVLSLWGPSQEHPAAGLRSLPATPFITQDEVFRRAAADGFLMHGGDFYSVPQGQAGKSLWIRKRGDFVSVSTPSGDVVATHRAGPGRGEVIMDTTHFTPHQRCSRETHLLERAFLQRFPGQRTLLSLLLAQQRSSAAEHLKAILRIADEYSEDSWQAAFQKAIRYNNFSHRFLRGFLRGVQGSPLTLPAYADAIQGELF